MTGDLGRAMTDNLTRETLSGLKWTYGATALSVLLQVGYTAIMGRLLTPADFGLVAMAMVFLRFGAHFAQMGVGPALVQKDSLTERDVRTAFTSSVLLGLIFALAIGGAAPLAEGLFDEASVVPVVQVLSVSFLLNGAGLTATSLLRRHLRFRALAVLQVGAYAIGYLAVGITLALTGAGVWSLVFAALSQTCLEAVLAYALARHSLRPLIAGREARRLYGFGSRVSVIGFLEFIMSSLDVMAIGRYAGSAPLGQYNRAALLINLPFQHLATGLTRVLFPTFSRIQSEVARLRRAYLGAVGITAALLAPIAAGMAIAAPELVRVILGPQWSTAGQVLPLLAAASVLNVLSHFGGVMCEAVAALNAKLLLKTASVLLLGTLLLLGADSGIVVLAGAVAASQFVHHLLYVFLMSRVLNLPIAQQWKMYLPSLLSALLIAACIGLVSTVLRPLDSGAALVLAAQVLTGGMGFALLFYWGPLVPVRKQLLQLLTNAGMFESPALPTVMVKRVLTMGR